MTVLRTASAVAVLLGVYFVLPLDGRGHVALRGLVVVVGLVVFGAVFVRQMRQIRDAQYPGAPGGGGDRAGCDLVRRGDGERALRRSTKPRPEATARR